ncbi:alpha-L-fucosidase [Halosimplex amylolyticum]|uniref:alpha-L-fucosidase n=1 Tax=Halosimplex amylolyticum TaxID=3396616 RepID=UPI003F57AD32
MQAPERDDASHDYYEADWESLAQHDPTPQWYQDAVLGFYFHWGPYSVPGFTDVSCAGYWQMYQPGTDAYELVAEEYGEPGTEFGYKDFVPLWDAENYDPERWAELFKTAGADFAGPGAEHHDGFALWDTDYNEWNSVDKGPGIDIVGTLIDAIREQGLRTAIAVHNWRTYITYDTGRRLCADGVDVNDPEYTGLYGPIHEPTHDTPTHNEYPGDDWPYSHWAERQNKWEELVDTYQFDLAWWEHMDSGQPPENLKQQMLAYYFNAAEDWDRDVVVTSKKLLENRRQDLPPAISPINREIGSLPGPRPQKWQSDFPLGDSWAYTPGVGCKSMDELTDLIVDNVSKNGMVFFSVAPKPDGTLPDAQVEGLEKLGEWMDINKPGLHGTVPAPFDVTGPDEWRDGSLRFLRKDKYLYAFELDSVEAPIEIEGARPVSDAEITMLGSEDPLEWHFNEDDGDVTLVIEDLPDPLPCDHAWAFQIPLLEASW